MQIVPGHNNGDSKRFEGILQAKGDYYLSTRVKSLFSMESKLEDTVNYLQFVDCILDAVEQNKEP